MCNEYSGYLVGRVIMFTLHVSSYNTIRLSGSYISKGKDADESVGCNM